MIINQILPFSSSFLKKEVFFIRKLKHKHMNTKQEPIEKLEEKLNAGIAIFSYRKKNGDIRYAAGTIHSDLIPVAKIPKTVSSFLHPKTGNANYYDLLSMDWRSFNPSELVRIQSAVAKK